MRFRVVCAALSLPFFSLASAPSSPGTGGSGYPAYLGGPQHTSTAHSAVTITAANASGVTSAWTARLPGPLYASPVTAAGVTYLGAGNGDFYALRAATGATIWHRRLPIDNCAGLGIASTATVAKDARTGNSVVYVGGADHYLYKLATSTGATLWRALVGGTDPHYYNWSSPTVANGHVYMGVSTSCSDPLGGGVVAFDATTGAVTGRYFVSTPTAGASIYSSVAVDSAGNVYADSGDSNGSPPGDSTSIIKLNGGNLTKLSAWKIPGVESLNLDFQASPTLFTANGMPMVGACDKNGVFYALRTANLSAGPAWSRRLGVSSPKGSLAFCGGAAVFNAGTLYVGANRRTAGAAAPGGVYALNPANGAVKWYTPLSGGPVLGSPSLDGAGVLAVPTFDTGSGAHNAVYLMDAVDGAILRTMSYPAPVFAQPVFANGELLIAGPTLQAYRP